MFIRACEDPVRTLQGRGRRRITRHACSVLVEPAAAWRPRVHAVAHHHSYAARPYRVDIPLSAEPPAIVDGLLVAQDVTLTLEMDSAAVATLSALEEAVGGQAGAASSVVDPSCAVGVRCLVAW